MMIVVAPTVGEEGLPQVVERVSGYVATSGGSIETYTHDNPWGRRRLAYPIQKFQDAFYVLYYFESAPPAIDEIERELRLDEQIIRHLIIKYDAMAEHSSNPSPYARMHEQPEETEAEEAVAEAEAVVAEAEVAEVVAEAEAVEAEAEVEIAEAEAEVTEAEVAEEVAELEEAVVEAVAEAEEEVAAVAPTSDEDDDDDDDAKA
jgi:small subunit ribosomal protein S6